MCDVCGKKNPKFLRFCVLILNCFTFSSLRILRRKNRFLKCAVFVNFAFCFVVFSVHKILYKNTNAHCDTLLRWYYAHTFRDLVHLCRPDGALLCTVHVQFACFRSDLPVLDFSRLDSKFFWQNEIFDQIVLRPQEVRNDFARPIDLIVSAARRSACQRQFSEKLIWQVWRVWKSDQKGNTRILLQELQHCLVYEPSQHTTRCLYHLSTPPVTIVRLLFWGFVWKYESCIWW